MKIGYTRVSRDKQTTALQEDALKRDKRYVHRGAKGRFVESDDVSRSLQKFRGL